MQLSSKSRPKHQTGEGQAQLRRHLILEQWKAEEQSFPTDGHKIIPNIIKNKSKTNKKRTNIDNKNYKTQKKHTLWHSLRFSQHIINRKIL